MEIDNDYAWSTSKPLLASLVEVAEPAFILELGMGMHSTPLFINSGCDDIIFIDSDKEWLEYIKSNNVFSSGHEILFHDLGHPKMKSVFFKQLTRDQKLEIKNYYKELSNRIANNINTPKMLFVDNATCCRTLAINTLYKEFDVIIYHDCEPKGIIWYEYYFEKNLKKEYKNYVLKTPKSWTGCFINCKLDICMSLEDNIKKHVLTYSKEIGIDHNKIYLEREY